MKRLSYIAADIEIQAKRNSDYVSEHLIGGVVN